MPMITKSSSDIVAEQFANDWLLVIENDQESWNQLIDDVKSMDCNVIATTAYLREEWDVLIDQIETAVSKISDIVPLLLRQLLVMGDRPFELIARYVIDRIKEAN
ncbi:MAG: hypothetical protein EBU96_09940 [Actinobacteria bacterium]|jgi:hypothetical protein|nr:hypothetical protein [Actinomycetota bacterium]